MFGALFQYLDINWYTCFVIKTNENFIRLKKSVDFHRPNLLTKSCFFACAYLNREYITI